MLRDEPAERGHRRLAAERLRGRRRRSPWVTAASCVQLHVLGQRHAAAVDLEDLQPAVASGMPISISRSKRPGRRRAGSSVLRDVGGADDDHLAARLAARPSARAAGRRPASPPRPALLALGRDGVDLVEEDDARRVLLRLLEDAAQLGLALAVELVDDLRPADADEVRRRSRGRRRGRSASCRCRAGRRAARPGALDAQPLEDLG